MAGVAGHSGYRGDPWGRLARTSYFLAATTFGPDTEARATIERIKAVHARVRGPGAGRSRLLGRRPAPSGMGAHRGDRQLPARPPALRRAAARPGRGRDGYVADTARIARELGVVDPPESEAALAARIAAFRPELEGTPEARSTARFLLLRPPLALAARAPYALLAAAAVELLPRWARAPLGLPYLPVVEATLVRVGGRAITQGIRWVMSG